MTAVIDKARKASGARVGTKRAKPRHDKVTAGEGREQEAAATVEAKGQDVLVPLDRLVLSDANVRKVGAAQGIAELAALIESQGQLQRLSVVAMPDGFFAVVAGGRRLRAMQMLMEQGLWLATQPVECKVYPSEQAVQVSLAENSGREAMHPADQMEAFQRLIEGEGLTVAQVAGRFGVTPLTVERRLKLARLAPRFLAMYRADEIEPDQLQALALTEDPAAQEAIWDGLPSYDRNAWRIRSAITEGSCNADGKAARFVGLEAYEAAGGTVRRDLFASDDDLASVFLDNPALLQKLAMDKLRAVAETVNAEGWGWAECALEFDGLRLRGYGRLQEAERDPTADEAQALAQLEADYRTRDDAYQQHQDEGDPDAEDYELIEQQLCEALDTAEETLAAARAALRQWSPEQMREGGALVRLDHRGQVVIDRGLIRPQDRKGAAQNTATKDSRAVDDADSKEDSLRRVKARPPYSEPLLRDLTAHRTAAIQAALLQNPRIALVTLVHRMAETVFGLYGRGNDVVKVHVHVTGDSALAQDASEYAQSQAGTLLSDAETHWGDRLPGTPEALFQWLLVQEQETLLDLLAYCTARSLNAVASRERGFDHSDVLVLALGVDMRDWWKPTAASYFGRVSRAQALEAIRDATGKDESFALRKLKKSELVARCAHLFADVRWVPEPLRAREAAKTALEAEQVSD